MDFEKDKNYSAKNYYNKVLNNYINTLADILKIKSPKISYDTSHFQTKTTLAVVNYSLENPIIFIREKSFDYDFAFAIAHEMRHIWQIQTDKNLYFSNYDYSGSLSTEEYNNQPAEIDANAFAKIVMVDMFGLTPLFKGLPNTCKKLIDERISELTDNGEINLRYQESFEFLHSSKSET